MSNILTITVGKFFFKNQQKIAVLADDAYGSAFFLFDKFNEFIQRYPSKDDLILDILEHDAFEDGAFIKEDKTYTLLSINQIDVIGYEDLVQNERN